MHSFFPLNFTCNYFTTPTRFVDVFPRKYKSQEYENDRVHGQRIVLFSVLVFIYLAHFKLMIYANFYEMEWLHYREAIFLQSYTNVLYIFLQSVPLHRRKFLDIFLRFWESLQNSQGSKKFSRIDAKPIPKFVSDNSEQL